MSINKKLNEHYFDIKKKRTLAKGTQSFSGKKIILKVSVACILIFLYAFIHRSCQERIEKNEKEYLEKNSEQIPKH